MKVETGKEKRKKKLDRPQIHKWVGIGGPKDCSLRYSSMKNVRGHIRLCALRNTLVGKFSGVCFRFVRWQPSVGRLCACERVFVVCWGEMDHPPPKNFLLSLVPFSAFSAFIVLRTESGIRILSPPNSPLKHARCVRYTPLYASSKWRTTTKHYVCVRYGAITRVNIEIFFVRKS